MACTGTANKVTVTAGAGVEYVLTASAPQRAGPGTQVCYTLANRSTPGLVGTEVRYIDFAVCPDVNCTGDGDEWDNCCKRQVPPITATLPHGRAVGNVHSFAFPVPVVAWGRKFCGFRVLFSPALEPGTPPAEFCVIFPSAPLDGASAPFLLKTGCGEFGGEQGCWIQSLNGTCTAAGTAYASSPVRVASRRPADR